MKHDEHEYDAGPAEGPANEPTGQPRTLRQLGVDGALAGEMEAVMRVLGATRGDEVVGFKFRTPDGQTVRLRLEESAANGAHTGDRAA